MRRKKRKKILPALLAVLILCSPYKYIKFFELVLFYWFFCTLGFLVRLKLSTQKVFIRRTKILSGQAAQREGRALPKPKLSEERAKHRRMTSRTLERKKRSLVCWFMQDARWYYQQPSKYIHLHNITFLTLQQLSNFLAIHYIIRLSHVLWNKHIYVMFLLKKCFTAILSSNYNFD